MDTFDFPQTLLEQAEKITLSDLLDSPSFQPWVVSMMANSIKCSHNFDMEEDDVVLEYRVEKVFKTIPWEERIHLFSLCSQMVKQRQAESRQQKKS
jgi:hypothetical protein